MNIDIRIIDGIRVARHPDDSVVLTLKDRFAFHGSIVVPPHIATRTSYADLAQFAELAFQIKDEGGHI